MNMTTQKLIEIFTEINKIPRKSKNETKIIEWLITWAKTNNIEYQKDNIGNIVIKVNASMGYENKPTVILQTHMDMVCEKTPDSNHDFSKDPIQILIENDWITANKTTLGADNGMGMAIALNLALDKTIKHPALELLFTVDEETGLTGVNALEASFIKGQTLINLDSEDEGVATIGCAGGVTSKTILNLSTQKSTKNQTPLLITIQGLQGGHSGVDINLNRGNAIKILANILEKTFTNYQFQISEINGGAAHNAIPRNSDVLVFVDTQNKENFKISVTTIAQEIKKNLEVNDPNFSLTITEQTKKEDIDIISTEDTLRIITILNKIPSGVITMSNEIEGLVQTSNNLATIKLIQNNSKEISLEITCSQRSSNETELKDITSKIKTLSNEVQGETTTNCGYSPWQPNWNSLLVEKCKTVYKNLFNKELKIEVIHAGLECAVISKKCPSVVDMVSVGPTIKNPHCPDEKLYIPSIQPVWEFLVTLLETL